MKGWTLNDQAIESFYESFRSEYLNATKKYSLTVEERIDIYQEAIIVLYEAIKGNKISDQQNVKAYLFGTCRNMIRNHIKANIKDREESKKLIAEAKEDYYIDDHEQDLSPVQENLYTALQKLSDRCRQLLTLFYFRQYSIEAIMHSMNYNNENVTKSNKSRCLKTLRDLLTSKEN